MSDVTHESTAPRSTAYRPASVSAIIPCLDEEAAIAGVVTAVFAQDVSEVIVVMAARGTKRSKGQPAGARVIVEPQRGYGRAIQAGIAAMRKDAEIVSFSMATAVIP